MAKQPAFMMYPGDWMKDPALRMCSVATRGIWMDILCAIYELASDGSITGTVEQLARIPGVSSIEMRAACDEMRNTNVATVTEADGKVTLVCRRIRRQVEAAQDHQNRQLRYRAKKRDGKMTRVRRESDAASSYSSSTSVCAAPASAAAALRAREEPLPASGQPPVEAQAAAAAESPWRQFPKTAALIQQSFPGTDSALIVKIVMTALEHKPDARDEDVTAALVRTHKGPGQRSAALWLKTVPAELDGQARAHPPPRESCPVCGDTGEIFQPEFEGQPNSAWLNLPHERVFAACPRCRGAPKKPNGAENGKENTAHGRSGGTSRPAR